MINEESGIDAFEQDATLHGGYLYTTDQQLSSSLATQTSTEMILQMGSFAGRSVLDIGCGDGFYTIQFWDRGGPREMVGVDASPAAIKIANANKRERTIRFEVGDAHHLAYPDNRFDLVLIQSILHHDDHPQDIIREAFRLAPEILIHEPNGNNPGLKIIEKLSPYHREHNEKSYTSRQLVQWIRQAGGIVIANRFAGFVPMFCPDWLARLANTVEPLVESTPVLNTLGCAVYVLVARRCK